MNPRYPNILQTFGLLGIYILLSLGLALMIQPLMGIISESLVTLLASFLSMAIVILFALQFKKASFSYLFEGMKLASMPVYLVSILFTIFMILAIDPITSFIPMPEWLERIMAGLIKKNFASFMTVVIMAPIMEELLFRKVIFEGFLENYSLKKAILMSAFMFALFHLNPWQGIGAFVAGVYLAYLFYKTGDIILCMFVHFLNNGLGFSAFFYFDDPLFSITDVMDEPAYLILTILIGFGGMYVCYRYLENHFQMKES
ncbi:MAG: lysostaphin resistance A-like protein [Bacteroidota bacterium]